ncbi:MAG TPA: biotin/lipoyl-containing protein, partial [Gemmata sp.]|nr:biotin/lipoyl-containing protein [Gemmata sp.]
MDFPLPPVGEGLFEVELVNWLVRPGDAVSRGQGLAEVMSDKASMEVPAPFAGTITALAATPGTKVKVGQVLLTYEPVGELAAVGAGAPTARAERPHSPPPSSPPSLGVKVAGGLAGEASRPPNGHPASSTGLLPPAAPSIRMLARKLGIDLSRVRGSGPGGRVLVEDLASFIRPKGNEAPAAIPTKTDTSKFDLGVAGTRVKLVGLRRQIAEHMVEAKHKIPHYS